MLPSLWSSTEDKRRKQLVQKGGSRAGKSSSSTGGLLRKEDLETQGMLGFVVCKTCPTICENFLGNYKSEVVCIRVRKNLTFFCTISSCVVKCSLPRPKEKQEVEFLLPSFHSESNDLLLLLLYLEQMSVNL